MLRGGFYYHCSIMLSGGFCYYRISNINSHSCFIIISFLHRIQMILLPTHHLHRFSLHQSNQRTMTLMTYVKHYYLTSPQHSLIVFTVMVNTRHQQQTIKLSLLHMQTSSTTLELAILWYQQTSAVHKRSHPLRLISFRHSESISISRHLLKIKVPSMGPVGETILDNFLLDVSIVLLT